MNINLLYLPLFNFAYLFFFLFLSTYLLVLFSLLCSAVGTLLLFSFPVCALVSFVWVDTIFGFVCSQGEYIVLYFCWTVLILLWVCLHMYIFSHIFYYCYKLLSLHWAFEVLWNFPFFLSSSFFFLSVFIILTLNFLNLLYFYTSITFFAFPTVLFHLQLNFNIYKPSSASI